MAVDALVVAQDDDVCTTLCMALEDEGYRTARATNATDALAWVRAHDGPALLFICDLLTLTSPNTATNGAALLRALHHDEAFWCERSAILLTTLPTHLPLDVAHIATSRGLPIVQMPFDLANLLGVVAESVFALAIVPLDESEQTDA